MIEQQSNNIHMAITRERMVLAREDERSQERRREKQRFDRTLIDVPRHACFVRLRFRFVRPDLLGQELGQDF
jgi:hypothetical protein